jgi:Glyoxalase-like domain
MSVRFKDLCIDSGPGETLGRFWAEALGLTFEPDGKAGTLLGSKKNQRVWMNVVPEPKTVKHRVHLDVHTAAVDDLLRAGATVLEPADAFRRRWTVMADPEGGEFCAFVRPPAQLPDYRLYELVVDSAAPKVIASWWARLFGVELGGAEHEGWFWLDRVPGAPFEAMTFVPVPEPKTVKNRVHWDVTVASLAQLTDAGATVLRARDEEISWNVMADPEGNEFCAFAGND